MPRESPPQDYYPSVKVVFSVRFEEFDPVALEAEKKKLKVKLAQTLKGVKSTRVDLAVVPDPKAPPGVVRYVLSTPGSDSTSARPTSAATSVDKLTFDLGGIIPKTLTLKRNSIRLADECDIEIQHADFPIDPRCIRACAVEVYIGTIDPTQFAMGIQGYLRGVNRRPGQQENEPLHLVPDFDAKGRSNLRFQGWVDDWEMTFPDGAPTIKLKCVDNTRLLIAQVAPPNFHIDPTMPIDKAIASYLATFPQMQGLIIEFRGDKKETVARTLKSASGNYYPKDLGPAPAKAGAATGDSLAVWDYLTDACGILSYSIRVEGQTVIIQRPRNILARESTRAEDQYTPRTISGQFYPFRMLAYGRNLMELSMSRNFTRKAVKNVEVRCYDPNRKAPLVGRYPKEAKDFVTAANPGDGKVDTKWTVYRVDGVTDQKTIDDIAEDYYQLVGRNEIESKLVTRNLASYGGGNEDPDLLDLYAGDTIEVGMVRDVQNSSLLAQEKQQRAIATNVKLMTDRGFPVEFAQAFSKAYNDAGFQREFRVREAQIQWDTEKGIDINIAAANYIEIRAGKTSAQEEADGDGGPSEQKPGTAVV